MARKQLTRTRPQQLALLDTRRLPRALRLDERTRQIGLVGVAEAKAILDEQARRRAERDAAHTVPFVRKAA
ncbi:MAG: hypothetical protein AB7Q42_00635 [Acidimicrobiia bacterium]